VWEDLATVDGAIATYTAETLTPGELYDFSIVAENIHDFGLESTPISEYAAQRPDQPNQIVTSVQNTNIKVTWAEPVVNHRPVTLYEIVILDNGAGTYAEDTTLCDGDDDVTKSVLYCIIAMRSLRVDLSDYDYALQEMPLFKVRAYNERGWSDYSDPNTEAALIQTEPDAMAPVTRNAATVEAEIIIDWVALANPEDGYATIAAYNLQWDKGTGGFQWYDLYGVVPTATLLQFSLTTEIVNGGVYQFKVRAANIHGWGEFSPVTTIKAAKIPEQVISVVTSIDPLTGGVLIDWAAPHDGSQAIEEYLVEIANDDTSAWFEDTTNCDGADPSLTSCIIPMDVLVTGDYNLAFDQLVEVRVSAYNSYGFGATSTVNTVGAKIRQKPD